jgi:soluble lytic murein transglycosylase-like protein
MTCRRLASLGISLCAALCIVLRAPAPSLADVYSWTDSDGVVHYTNIRPTKGGGAAKWKKVMNSQPDAGSKASAQRGGCPRCDKVRSNDNSPERFNRYDAYIFEASELFKIPVALIRAVIHVESDYDVTVVSAMDAKGLMQLMPSVVEDMGVRPELVFDPRENIMGGTRLLRYLANRYEGDLTLTIAAYHAGPGSLAKFGNTVPPYPFTQQYVKMVMGRYQEYKAKEAAVAP